MLFFLTNSITCDILLSEHMEVPSLAAAGSKLTNKSGFEGNRRHETSTVSPAHAPLPVSVVLRHRQQAIVRFIGKLIP